LFNACIELSGILRDETDVVRRLIHHHDWRNQVIGNIVAVLNRDNRYEEDLVAKLKKGVHFPSPLAAGWLIISTGKTIPDMEAFLVEISKTPDMSHDSIN
jgi:hypothetical protein